MKYVPCNVHHSQKRDIIFLWRWTWFWTSRTVDKVKVNEHVRYVDQRSSAYIYHAHTHWTNCHTRIISMK